MCPSTGAWVARIFLVIVVSSDAEKIWRLGLDCIFRDTIAITEIKDAGKEEDQNR